MSPDFICIKGEAKYEPKEKNTEIKNFLEFPKNNNYNELLNIDGIGETQIKSIKNFINKEIPKINKNKLNMG